MRSRASLTLTALAALAAVLSMGLSGAGAAGRGCDPDRIARTHDHSRAAAHGMRCRLRAVGRLRVSTKGGLGRIAVKGALAAVVQRDEGIVSLVDVSDPTAMRVLGRFDNGARDPLDGDVAFSHDGKYVFYARQTNRFSEDGVHVLDVSDPSMPQRVFYEPQGGTLRIAYHRDDAGEWVISLDAVTGLVIHRFSRESGTLVPAFADVDPLLKVGGPGSGDLVMDRRDELTGKPYLYVTTGRTGLSIYDLSDPTQPELVGEWDDAGLGDIAVYETDGDVKRSDFRQFQMRRIFAAREYWFDATTPPQVVTLDASDITAGSGVQRILPTRSLGLPADQLWRVRGLEVRGTELFVANGHGGLAGYRIEAQSRRLARYFGKPSTRPTDGTDLVGAPHFYDVEASGRFLLVTDAVAGTLTALLRSEPDPDPIRDFGTMLPPDCTRATAICS